MHDLQMICEHASQLPTAPDVPHILHELVVCPLARASSACASVHRRFRQLWRTGREEGRPLVKRLLLLLECISVFPTRTNPRGINARNQQNNTLHLLPVWKILRNQHPPIELPSPSSLPESVESEKKFCTCCHSLAQVGKKFQCWSLLFSNKFNVRL